MKWLKLLYIKETNGQKNIKALFVECNVPALNQFVKDLENELDIEVEGCLLIRRSKKWERASR